jgi:hypothetical protein
MPSDLRLWWTSAFSASLLLSPVLRIGQTLERRPESKTAGPLKGACILGFSP